jgi:heme A synthase
MKILRRVAQAFLLVLMIAVGLQVLIGLPHVLNSLNQPPEMLSMMLGQMGGGALMFVLFFVVFRKLGGRDEHRTA